MADANKKEIEGMPIASKPECVDGPRQQLIKKEIEGMPIASKPGFVDGPRQ